MVFFSSGRWSCPRPYFGLLFLHLVLRPDPRYHASFNVLALSNSLSRNAKKRKSSHLQSVQLAIQKNHAERIEKELVALHDAAKKTKGEVASAKMANPNYCSICYFRCSYSQKNRRKSCHEVSRKRPCHFCRSGTRAFPSFPLNRLCRLLLSLVV